ncbi:MAG: MinD/ParA family protein [Myxococcota bacterium]
MPRDLGDVLHYFLPDEERAGTLRRGSERFEAFGERPLSARPAALPILAIPVGDRDVVRAAYAWNLAVEVARRGASATLVASDRSETSPLWPEPGRGPVGTEVALSSARSFGELGLAALDIAVKRAADSTDGGVVLVTVPPEWFREAADGRALTRWVLLFSAAETPELLESYGLAKQILRANPDAEVGVTIHGVRRIAEAQGAFDRLAGAAVRHLDRRLTSYGLLVDDLHVYRAIVSRRPICLEHPQSHAAKALRDVARLLLDDARQRAVG